MTQKASVGEYWRARPPRGISSLGGVSRPPRRCQVAEKIVATPPHPCSSRGVFVGFPHPSPLTDLTGPTGLTGLATESNPWL